MDNLEKLPTKWYGTQDEGKQNINTTQYVLDSNIRKQTQTQKQLVAMTSRTSFLCGNRNRHRNTELRTQRHITGYAIYRSSRTNQGTEFNLNTSFKSIGYL